MLWLALYIAAQAQLRRVYFLEAPSELLYNVKAFVKCKTRIVFGMRSELQRRMTTIYIYIYADQHPVCSTAIYNMPIRFSKRVNMHEGNSLHFRPCYCYIICRSVVPYTGAVLSTRTAILSRLLTTQLLFHSPSSYYSVLMDRRLQPRIYYYLYDPEPVYYIAVIDVGKLLEQGSSQLSASEKLRQIQEHFVYKES